MVLALPLVLISKNVLLLTLILPLVLALPIKSELILDIGPGLRCDKVRPGPSGSVLNHFQIY